MADGALHAEAEGKLRVLTVGLTGSVGSGKSAVAEIWRGAGVPVVSADDLARAVVEPGSAGLRNVVEAFGEAVLSPDGSLDRAAMRRLVFPNRDARKRLESILHPLIEKRRSAWMEARRTEGALLAVAEVPLLFEVGLETRFDEVVVVHASAETRLRRLRNDRGLTEAEARRIMDAQMDPSVKRARAGYVIENEGTLEDLRRASLTLLDRLRERASGSSVRRRGP